MYLYKVKICFDKIIFFKTVYNIIIILVLKRDRRVEEGERMFDNKIMHPKEKQKRVRDQLKITSFFTHSFLLTLIIKIILVVTK